MIHTQKITPKRRQLLQLAAIGASTLYLSPVAAQQQRVVVGTWGGDYAKLLTKNIDDPYLKPKGIEVVQDQAADGPRRAKMVAEKRLPRGSVDVQAFSAANMFEMNGVDLLEPLDYDVSTLPHVPRGQLTHVDPCSLRHRLAVSLTFDFVYYILDSMYLQL